MMRTATDTLPMDSPTSVNHIVCSLLLWFKWQSADFTCFLWHSL